MKGLRYQHRRNCKLITPYGEVELDEDGHVANLDKFNPADLLTIEGFADVEVFGERKPKAKPAPTQTKEETEVQEISDDQYWLLIKTLTEKGGHLNSEGYLQMETLTAVLRERGWPPISGTRRIRITDEGRERDKIATAEKTKKNEDTRPR